MSGKRLIQEYKAAKAELSALREEQATISGNHARYMELSCPGGLTRQAEIRLQAARERLQAHVKRIYGVYAYEFRDYI